ncbi:MAG: HDIG domain-containing metalloprotein, partial [Cyanobacteria bacterium J06639_14]
MDALQQPPDSQESRFKPDRPLHSDAFKQNFNSQQSSRRWLSWLRSPSATPQVPLPPRTKRYRAEKTRPGRLQPTLALTLSVVTLTAAMGQRFHRQPELQVGTIAPKTLFALEDAVVIDRETTEAKRAAARTGALPVLVPDPEKNAQIANSLENLFQQVDILRNQAGVFPFIETNRLSLTTQHYIREAPALEWTAVWTVVKAVVAETRGDETAQENLEQVLTNRLDFRTMNLQQKQVAQDIVRYQQQWSAADFKALQTQVEFSRLNYQQALDDLARLSSAERGLPNDAILFRFSDSEWIAVQRELRRISRYMLLQGIAEGVPLDLLGIAVEAQLRGVVPSNTEPFAQALLLDVLEPNLMKDPERTRVKAEAAAEGVPEVKVIAREGEVIVRQGQKIKQSTFVLLDHFRLSRRRVNVPNLMGFGVLVAGGVGIFLIAERTVRPALRRQDHGLIVFMLLGVAGLNVVGLAVYSLPAVGLLVSSFYGATLGSTLVALLALIFPIGTRISTIPLIASAAGALVCSIIAPRLRSREELALLGGVIGLIQGAAYLALTWLINPVSLTNWYLPLTGAILQGIYGVVSSVVALGLSPYLEHLFDLVTPIRLAELSSPNRPMLKRLASEAPGTFQHTLFVASLAEAAARALRCNVELVRAGTLYHDIGKMHDPLGFIENQMGGPNKHDKINDPWVSADIIQKHVSEGLVMARRCRLPKAVRAFIPEHQGTMLISYFYHQAKEQAKSGKTKAINEHD